MARERLYSIQYLRGFAAIVIAWFHGIILQTSIGTESFQQKLNSIVGTSSVDLFFVISGFIMCYVSSQDTGVKDFVKFMKKKFIRINTVYYAASLLMLFCYVLLGRYEFNVFTIIKTLFILPIFDSGNEFTYPVIYVAWTLSYEWFFYILYSVFIILSIVKRREIYLIGLLFILFIMGFFFPMGEIHYTFVTNPMFLEFGMGMMIAVIYRNIKKVHILVPVLIGAIGIAILGYLFYDGCANIFGEAYLINMGVYTWHRVIAYGIPASLLLISFLFLEKKTSFRFPESNKLTLVGDASYSIFLTHPILYFLLFNTLKSQLSMINGDLLIILLVILSTVFGIFFHKVIENRLITLFNRILLGKK